VNHLSFYDKLVLFPFSHVPFCSYTRSEFLVWFLPFSPHEQDPFLIARAALARCEPKDFCLPKIFLAVYMAAGLARSSILVPPASVPPAPGSVLG
jgi:hypothetical protein